MGEGRGDVASRRDAIIERLAALARPDALEQMARFGITGQAAFGIPAADLKRIAREIGHDHLLAEALWQVPNLDVRGLATLVDDPALVDEAQMERWVASFDSWAACDGAIYNVFRHSPLAPHKVREWVRREEEFQKRAGFALIAGLAVVAKDAPDELFAEFLALIERYGDDPRNFVKKAVSWALREIGKRRPALHDEAVAVAGRMAEAPSPGAHWVGRDALKELTSDAVLARVRAAGAKPRTRGG